MNTAGIMSAMLVTTISANNAISNTEQLTQAESTIIFILLGIVTLVMIWIIVELIRY